MPAGTVLDYSGWRPTDAMFAQMKAFGIEGVVRYPYLGPGTEWKACQKAEYDRILNAGLRIAFTPELSASTWRGGYPKGLQIGEMARAWVHNLGFPDNRCMHFAVDENVAPAQLNLALDFLQGCSDGGGVGIQSSYGETSVIDTAFQRGVTCNGWRAAATSWDTNPSLHASMRQTTQQSYPFSGAYDENIVLKPDWGQHPAPTTGVHEMAPYSLWRDENGKVWRLDAACQSKVWVDGAAQLEWNQAVLRINGYADGIGEVGTNVTLRTFIATIPVSGQVTVNVPPVTVPPFPPVPSAADNAAATGVVVKSLLNQQRTVVP